MKTVRIVLGLILSALSLFGADDYPLGPDSKPQDGVPKGEVIKDVFEGSKISGGK